MDFRLSEEQQAIRTMALDFARDEIAAHAIEWDQQKHFPVETLRAAAALGMAGIYVRDDVGGTGLTRLDAAMIIEALATGCPAIASFVSIHNMCAGMIDRYGTDAQRRRLLPPLLTMDVLASYCLTEPGSGSDAAALKTKAVPEGDVYLLTGQKQFISVPAVRPLYRHGTTARKAEGISVFVSRRTLLAHLSAPMRRRWAGMPAHAGGMLDNVRVPVENRLGAEGEGFRIAMAGLDGGRLTSPAASLAARNPLIDKRRLCPGAPWPRGRAIANSPGAAVRLADMATDLEIARTFLWRAACALDAADPEAPKLCAMPNVCHRSLLCCAQ